MARDYSPIDLATAAGKLTKFARKNGYPDWDGDSSELAIVLASKRLADREGIALQSAEETVVQAVLSRSSRKLIPVL